jgi:hypothetical protein
MVRQLKNGLAFAFLATGAFANRCTVGMYDHADFGCTVCPAGKFAENPGSTDVRRPPAHAPLRQPRA